MAYIDIVVLDRVKNYLRLDECFTDDDDEIYSMINASCRYIEKRTNHLLYPRDVIYKGSCQVKVYDYPINSVITSPEPFVCHFSNFDIFPDVKIVELNVGYQNADLIPDALIQAALQMIKVWYYESEKQVNSTLIPESVKEVLDLYKRFL